MQNTGKKPASIVTIFGVGFFICERGIDVSGIVNVPLAISLWAIGGILIVSATILWIKYYISRRKKKPNQEIKDAPLKDEYIDKIIIDAKTPQLLEITEILSQMCRREAMLAEELFNKKVSIGKLEIIQTELQKQLQVKPIRKEMSQDARVRNTKKVIKKLGLLKGELAEKDIDMMVIIGTALDRNKVGLSQKLDKDKEYQELKERFYKKTPYIYGDNVTEAITAVVFFSFGFNSLYLLLCYMPQTHKERFPSYWNVPLSQFRLLRDDTLMKLIQYVRKTIEDELHGSI